MTDPAWGQGLRLGPGTLRKSGVYRQFASFNQFYQPNYDNWSERQIHGQCVWMLQWVSGHFSASASGKNIPKDKISSNSELSSLKFGKCGKRTLTSFSVICDWWAWPPLPPIASVAVCLYKTVFWMTIKCTKNSNVILQKCKSENFVKSSKSSSSVHRWNNLELLESPIGMGFSR